MPDWADPKELDGSVRAALRGLDPRNADRVARHLVVAGTLVDEEPELALEHARAARDRASRVAAVREAVGVAAYHAGDFAEAARELRAYRRMSGDEGYRAVLADCERALGRPEVALRLVAEALAGAPDAEERVELRLVEAGARRDLGEAAAARLVLEDALGGRPDPASLTGADPGRLRVAAAYADLLADQGDEGRAAVWREAVAEADPDDVAGLGDGPAVVFSEEPVEEPAVEEPAVEEPAVEEPSAEELSVPLPALDEDDELDLGDDIEAEVAELLGEDHPLARPDRDSGD
ncbi:tetratricopeptide repeat protein [Geodermatophilus sp. SYSU D00815]